MPVQIEVHIYTIARCAWDFANDHALRFGERIYKRALAYVSSADDRQLHSRCFRILRRDFGVWKAIDDLFE